MKPELWLTNIYDYRKQRFASLGLGSTPEEREYRLQWAKSKVIGPPKASEMYTSEQLAEMGMIGLYEPDNATSQTT